MKLSKIILGLFLLSITVLLINCEKRPVEKINTAKQLINKMEIENAEAYAPIKYNTAMNYYNKANRYITNKKYKKAVIELNQFIKMANSALDKTKNTKELEQKESSSSDIIYTDTTETAKTDSNKSAVEKAPKVTPKIEAQTHTVVVGDCLSEISMKYYGTSTYWDKIFETNDDILTNPHLIKPGQQLTIPAVELESEKTESPKLVSDGEYRVQEGESLWSIAKKIYPKSDSNHWQLLYQLNKEKLANPNILQKGMVLSLPDLSDYAYAPGDTVYLVKKGDNLWKISQKLTQDQVITNWYDLYLLNRDILSDSSMIYPDQLLKLPK